MVKKNVMRIVAGALAALLALAAILLPLVASAAGFEPALNTDTECELSFVGHYANFEALEAEFDRFNEYYPDVSLSYRLLDSYNRTIDVALDGDDAPDIYAAFTWMVGRDSYQPLFDHALRLDDPELGIDIDCIRDGLVPRMDDGGVYMLPVFATTYGMLINELLFDREGIDVPTTLDELIDACAAFRAAGYDCPMLGYNSSNDMFHALAFPYVSAQVKDDPEAIALLNSLAPEAGEYMRPMLETIKALVEDGCIDLDACSALENNYSALILRFFEGDIPMVICNGDTVSGTQKRESLSESFSERPFIYSFHPIPLSDELYFVQASTLDFAVNKDSANVDMAAEFMRFLISDSELQNMSRIKRLPAPVKALAPDDVYAAFAGIDEEHTIYEEVTNIIDDARIQLRCAAYRVANGLMTIDEAIAAYGTLAD